MSNNAKRVPRTRVHLKGNDAVSMQTAMFEPLRQKEQNADYVLFDLELPSTVAATWPLRTRSLATWKPLAFDSRDLAVMIRHAVVDQWPVDRLDFVVKLIATSREADKRYPDVKPSWVVRFGRPGLSPIPEVVRALTNNILIKRTRGRAVIVEIDRARLPLAAVVPSMVWIANHLERAGIHAMVRARGRALHGPLGKSGIQHSPSATNQGDEMASAPIADA